MEPKIYPAFPVTGPSAMAVFCGDPRFQPAMISFIEEELGLPHGEYVQFTVPGGVAWLSEPQSLPKDFKVLKEGIGFYLEHMRSIRRVILINHEDCKKYHALSELAGPLFTLHSKTVPDRQRSDLHKAASVVAGLVSGPIKVERYYAKFANPEHTLITFEQV